MKTLIAVCFAALAAQSAAAERRVNRPFTTINGRAVMRSSAAPAPAAQSAASAPAIGNEIVSAPLSDGGRSFMGGGRGFSQPRRANNTFWGGGARSFRGVRRADGDGETNSAPAEVPPHFNKPGAKILTAGQAPVYGAPEPAQFHTVAAGEIRLNEREAQHVGRSPGLRQGRKDKLPSSNPTGGGSSGGAAPNSSRDDGNDAF
ncbi:MAG: hypothetical protein HYZ74_03250 [Elusimicrobia bacterium]|nr:hypothetical protein [Elusimicrobiota bacterium]